VGLQPAQQARRQGVLWGVDGQPAINSRRQPDAERFAIR